MRPHLLILVASIGLGSGLLAQGSEPRDERVQVVLKNGHTMVGVAKSGLRCERQVHGRFMACNDNDDRAAGIRLWYYQNLDGYIFLDRKALDHVDVLGLLTPDESRELAAAMSAANAGSGGARAASRPSSRPSPQPDRPSTTDGATYSDEERALLIQFPPEKGWGPEKFGELQRRKIVMHVNPSVEEQAFVDAFPRYQVAWRKWAEEQGRKSEAAGGDDAHPAVKAGAPPPQKGAEAPEEKPADDDATNVEKSAKRGSSKSKQ